MSNLNGATEKRISERFCAADSDVTFESCDNVLFKVHLNNLKTHSEGFAPPDETSLSLAEVVNLTESADVLELLFQYIYPQRPPDMKTVNFGVFAGFAEAVEKYQVYAAMDVCNTRMEAAIPYHPLQVLDYAARHHRSDLLAKIEGSEYILLSPLEASKYSNLPIYVAWTSYYAHWLEALKYAHRCEQWPTTAARKEHNCKGRSVDIWRCFAKISRRLGANPTSLLNLNSVFETKDGGCVACGQILHRWHSKVEAKVEALPNLSTFL